MILYGASPVRLRELGVSWNATLDRWRGPVPRSLGLAHMAAETNGVTDPPTRDATQRTVGIMRLRVADVLRLGQTEAQAKDPALNLYLWCQLANDYGRRLHAQYSTWWTSANLDFWAAVRATFVLGLASTETLFTTVHQAGAAYRSTAGVQQWIRTLGQGRRFGRFGPFELRQLANHLDEVIVGMTALDGANYVAAHFFATVPAFKVNRGEDNRLSQGIRNLTTGETMSQFTP